AAERGEVAVLRALLLDDQAGLAAALLGEQRRIDVRDVLTDHIGGDALERGDLVNADIVVGQLSAHLDVEVDHSGAGKSAEDLSELLDQGDAGADERIDHTTCDVDRIRDEVALEG